MISRLLKSVKTVISKSKLKKLRQYISIGNSHLLNEFNLLINKPIPNKIYLTIGDDTMLSCQAIFETSAGEIIIGSKSFIGNSKIICRSKVIIGDNVFIAWGTTIYDHDSHSLDYKERELDIQRQLDDYRNGRNFIHSKNWDVVRSKPITICSNAWIGMNCIILKGVTVGEGAIVAAGSVVSKDVPAWTVVAGNPARVVKALK